MSVWGTVYELERAKVLGPRIDTWQPWKNAPRDGRWIIARCNDKVTLLRVSWGIDRKGLVGWCGADGYYGDGLFEPHGGWIDWPRDE